MTKRVHLVRLYTLRPLTSTTVRFDSTLRGPSLILKTLVRLFLSLNFLFCLIRRERRDEGRRWVFFLSFFFRRKRYFLSQKAGAHILPSLKPQGPRLDIKKHYRSRPGSGRWEVLLILWTRDSQEWLWRKECRHTKVGLRRRFLFVGVQSEKGGTKYKPRTYL